MQTKLLSLTMALMIGFITAGNAEAFTVRGTGNAALRGNDLTDLDDVHNEGAYVGVGNTAGFDAVFFANDEPGFGGGEFAFNVFDNATGGGGNKWCCGPNTGFPLIVGADFSTTILASEPATAGIQLEAFTLTSSNDTANRDPRVFAVEGSNDTTDGFDGTWDVIFERTDGTTNLFTSRNQVVEFSSVAGDVFQSTSTYKAFRLNTTATNATSGAFHALSEFELFGEVVNAVPEPTSAALLGLGALAMVRRRRAAA